MGYYTISIFPTSQEIKMIVTEFGKFIYNRLPMGTWALGDIFQDKLCKLLGDIEGDKIYFDDILVLSNKSFSDHI